MNQDKYVFSQLSTFLNRTQFNNYVRKYNGMPNTYLHMMLPIFKKKMAVELFFKLLKQHLKIKKFWSTTLNTDQCSYHHLLFSSYRTT